MRRPTFLPAVLLLLLGIAAACGDTGNGNGNDAASTTTAAARTTTTTSAATTTTIAGGGSKRFVFALDDGSLNIDGDATSCTSSNPVSVKVTFKGETSQITVDAANGKGTVDVIGATQFQGTITSVEIGANQEVKVSGTGTLAGSGSPVGFTVTGSCA